jgi:hypothetical protein
MPKRRRAADSAATVDIVSQLECAIRRPQATLIGAAVGGLVPWFARTLAHEEVPAVWTTGNHGLALVMVLVVLGCALFSALTVYKFGRAVFSDARKAVGFTVALEGVMLVSHGITSVIALIVLIAINAISNGSAIAMARDATCKRREASRRSAVTRSQGRAKLADRKPRPISTTTSQKPGLVPMPRWATDVADAEIISEESFS